MSQQLLFINGPSQDMCDRFFGWPTSLLYAIAPTIRAIRKGELNLDYEAAIFDPVWYIEGKNDIAVKAALRTKLHEGTILCASATYDSIYPTLQLFQDAK